MKPENKLHERLILARAAAVLALGGRSPRQRGDEKTMKALNWVYRWGWSSPSTIEILGGGVRTGLAARLVKRGFLRATRTESGGAQAGVPSKILTLTESGQSEVERFCENLLYYERDPYRVRQDHLRHDNLAQSATLKSLINNTISSFATERELSMMSKAGIKQPDVVWYHAEKIIGVEIELTGKWHRTLDQFVESCLLALHHDRLTHIAIVSDAPAIIKRYQSAFKPGESLPIWRKADTKWAISEHKKVPGWATDKIMWKLVEDKPKKKINEKKENEPSEL